MTRTCCWTRPLFPATWTLFRLEDFSTTIVCTERFADACQRLGLDGVTFHRLASA
ncbi:double-CXXCG motif protein [Archangium violaceum]|uniref:double-CXXCG motif protein n=1 Tax=Archangium violaceum TaxID=83451 RepID=UPI001EEFD73E|nr:double-CXXCG motif protein [Archangium violaceum]